MAKKAAKKRKKRKNIAPKILEKLIQKEKKGGF